MSQLEKYKFNNESIRVLEFFSGVGMQRMAFDKLGVNYESVGTSEIDIPAILSYASIHDGLLESDESFEYPSKEEMLSYLSERNIGLDFKTGKLKLPKNLDKIKQLYRAVIVSKCFGDISKINPSDLPDFDFMTYSFPCQSISVSGRTEGIIKGQTRSGLLYECEKVIEYKRPKYLLLENVKNLVGKQFKPQFDEWLEYLESLGYTNYWKVLNSKNYGIPQNRERVFVLSILGEHDPYEFHSGFELDIKLKDILESEVDEKYYLSKEVQDRFKPNEANQVIENSEPLICASRGRNPENPSDRTAGIYLEQRLEINHSGTSNTITTVQKDNYVLEPNVLRPERTEYGKAVRKQYESGEITEKIGNMREYNPRTDGVSNTLTTVQKDNYLFETNFRIRKLTPKECWRLMGIDDECFDKAQQVNSNSQLYKQAGNGIVVDVLYYIFKELFKNNIIE